MIKLQYKIDRERNHTVSVCVSVSSIEVQRQFRRTHSNWIQSIYSVTDDQRPLPILLIVGVVPFGPLKEGDGGWVGEGEIIGAPVSLDIMSWMAASKESTRDDICSTKHAHKRRWSGAEWNNGNRKATNSSPASASTSRRTWYQADQAGSQPGPEGLDESDRGNSLFLEQNITHERGQLMWTGDVCRFHGRF
jgi:hypothetical protein